MPMIVWMLIVNFRLSSMRRCVYQFNWCENLSFFSHDVHIKVDEMMNIKSFYQEDFSSRNDEDEISFPCATSLSMRSAAFHRIFQRSDDDIRELINMKFSTDWYFFSCVELYFLLIQRNSCWNLQRVKLRRSEFINKWIDFVFIG